MAQRNILFVVFLAIVSANMIQAVVGKLEEGNVSNFINLVTDPLQRPDGQLSHAASSAASAAAHALGGFRSYVDDLRTGLQNMNIQPRFKTLHRFIDGSILPDFGAKPVPNIVPAAGQDTGSAAASSAAAASAVPGAIESAIAPRLSRSAPEMGTIGNDGALSDAIQGPMVAMKN
ncbi:hypothetical protein HN011_003298 [Eciton burchellii]|nr:hypothetical protein HN011_003298 [Eciton burchellii]